MAALRERYERYRQISSHFRDIRGASLGAYPSQMDINAAIKAEKVVLPSTSGKDNKRLCRILQTGLLAGS